MQATSAASKDRRQRKLEAEKLKTVRGLFPDESLDVILGQLRANDWVMANAIDALESLRDVRAPGDSASPPPRPQQHQRPPSRAQPASVARPKDDWVVLSKADHHDAGSEDEVGHHDDGAGVRQVEEALRKSVLWDDPQAFSTSTLATPSSETTGDSTRMIDEERPDRDQVSDRGVLNANGAEPCGTSTEADIHGSSEGAMARERRRRAEEQRRMMEEAEMRWEEEKQRQAEAERLYTRLQEHRERYHSGSFPTTAATVIKAEAEEHDEREAATTSTQEEEEEERESRQVAHAGMVALSRTLAGRLDPEQLGAVRAIPFTVTTGKAAKIFHDWRLSLWFTPTDFSQLLEAPSVSMTYVPYYCTNVKSTCKYVSKVEVTRTDGRKEHRMVEGQRESVHERSVCGAAHLRPEVAGLLSAIEPWDMEASIPLAPPPVRPAALSGGDDAVSVATLLEPRDVWCSIREWIAAREKVECGKDGLLRSLGDGGDADEEGREASQQQRVVETTVTRMEFPETRYRVVYVPLYLVRYTQGDPHGERREYFFAINALTGKSHGQRPFGVGKVLGRGISFLEGLLGLKDHHTVQIVRGSQLSQIDRRICYVDMEHYLIWPASHSYVITHATGFITLRNRSATHPIALLSQMRESKDFTARYVLRPGETQSFNYRGFWCIRLQVTESDDTEGQPAALPSALSRAATFLFRASAQPSPAPAALEQEVRWEEMIEVVGYSIDEGNHGNLLGMA